MASGTTTIASKTRGGADKMTKAMLVAIAFGSSSRARPTRRKSS
jgi:hypothetical protein